MGKKGPQENLIPKIALIKAYNFMRKSTNFVASGVKSPQKYLDSQCVKITYCSYLLS